MLPFVVVFSRSVGGVVCQRDEFTARGERIVGVLCHRLQEISARGVTEKILRCTQVKGSAHRTWQVRRKIVLPVPTATICVRKWAKIATCVMNEFLLQISIEMAAF